MFGFNSKKTIEQAGILTGLTDYHTHILPGVDDGVNSLGEALQALAAYEKLGVRKVVFTPHVMEDYPQNTAAFLRSRFDEFRKLYTGSIGISLGAEYMLDGGFGRLLATGDLLPLAGDCLLIETPFMSPPLNLMQRLDQIRSRGYFVVLAHPERYAYMCREDYRRLKDAGVLFQMNLLSAVGIYGKDAELKSHELLSAGWYDILGTDIHDLDYHLHKITRSKLPKKLLGQLSELKNRSLPG
ncbi:CpsB/CapC family capsule biosynthesis tyrosine phosphatase [uncultured Alistipes sp.]|jgi:hypothetical protein|uniref:tyrosine-protein phosphatase n=1 Tax=uncultured Alistipes sp. TaxID=538949 RepID=UPI0025D0E15D|nr:CpsB/CapC family capsule biosynthesis tyrosine phosphatase [uncultured Alistipes sp.]